MKKYYERVTLVKYTPRELMYLEKEEGD